MSKLTLAQKESRKTLHKDVARNWPLRKGKNEFLKALVSETVTRGEAIVAACYHCCGGYEGGPKDCMEAICPLYKFMPYREEEDRVAMPEEQKIQLIARFQAGKERKTKELTK